MNQQILALALIIFLLARLLWQKKRKKIQGGEFVFWLIFWSFSGLAIVFIKYIDSLVSRLGFSSQGIDVLLYLGVVFLFYLIFKIRLRQEKLDQDITKITRTISLKDKE